MMWPVVAKTCVFHVGCLDATPPRRSSSYEGPGLSVSLHPSAWRRIAEGVGGATWALMRKDGQPGRFVQYHDIASEQRSSLIQQAVDLGLLTPVTVWRLDYHDDEWEEDRYMLFNSLADAETEAEGYDTPSITEVSSYVAAGGLADWWKTRFDRPLDALLSSEMAIIYLLEQMSEFDGVWWDDDLDAVGLWAPRGVIFQNRLGEWQGSITDAVPDEDDECD